MSTQSIVVAGTLQSDGQTLLLDQKLGVPPGRVTLTLQSSRPAHAATMLETLDRIHTEQKQRNHKPMTEEEMATEIEATRSEADEDETRWKKVWSETRSPKDV